jgi:hypothetical protein
MLRIGRYAFDASQKLEAFSIPTADAYAAEGHPEYPNGLYALINKTKLPARLDVWDALSGGRIGVLQTTLAHAVVKIGGYEQLGFMMEQPPGEALMKDLKTVIKPMREDDIRQHLIKPIFDTLITFQERAIFHGNISPMNLFSSGKLAGLMLGECISGVPGINQLGLFEPIERAQCPVYAKGDSTIEDDIFALGVTVFLLAAGKNPFASLSNEDLIRARLETGSSTLMLNHAKLPPTILEFVRGVCGDQPKQRWNFGEIDNWIGGQRVALRATSQMIKASRSILFNGKEYFRARNLADALVARPAEVRTLVDNKEIIRWLQRGLGDHPLYEAVNMLIETVTRQTVTDEILTAKLAIALDPQGPIRYKSLRFMPLAIGTLLCKAYLDKNTATQQEIAELMASDILTFWTQQPGNGNTYLLSLAKDVENARGYMNVAGLGYGLERVLYELQRNAPCLSEFLSRHYVSDLPHLLSALDEMASDGRRPTEPLDRHSAGFLAARMGKSQDNLLKALNPNKEPAVRNIAILTLLANVHNRFGMAPMPKLCGWLAETLKPALDRFHSRALRQNLQKNLNKLVAEGELSQLQKAVDSPQVVEGDLNGFRIASQQYRSLQQQMYEVNIMIENKNTIGIAVGQRVAAAMSVALGLTAVAAAIVRAVGG